MIRLPIDTKSLYFNIKNDNLTGHTPTVASPLKKTLKNDKLENILLLKHKEIDISSKKDLIDILVKHSKSKVLIKNMFCFNKISVNGKTIDTDCCFGCYIKEEIDETKVQFGRLKLHYPSKLIYSDEHLNINNKAIYKKISEKLNNYAFIIQAFEYDEGRDILNFDALIVGENEIPYSKVFINEKGVGNKFNEIFNENADDYDREIILLRKAYGDKINPFNYMEYFRKLKLKAIDYIEEKIKKPIINVSFEFPYSLFDFYYYEDNQKKYGILRVTATNNVYFNISFIQQIFMAKNVDDVNVYLVRNIIESPEVDIINYSRINNMTMNINSIKYEEE